MRLNSRAFLESPVQPRAVHQVRLVRRRDRGTDRADRRPGRADLAGAARAARPKLRPRAASVSPSCRRPPLCRIAAPRHRQGAPRESGLIDLAYAKGLPLVATNEPYFAATDDYEAHDALLCIAGGRLIAETEREQLTPDHRFKTRAEMAVLFADIPEALASTVEIAERCSFRPMTRKPILPLFTVGAGASSDAAAVSGRAERQAEEGLAVPAACTACRRARRRRTTSKRLEFELDVIIRMKYPGYFLIVSDFIKWAKAQDIPVGPGRGSGAGSLVAWALTITDLDPIRFGLLFERFLNPERVSMPDFDIDFCQDRRGEVIDYVQQHYGRDQVAQIITFGTLQARGVLRDVGRVLQMPYGQVDKLANWCRRTRPRPSRWRRRSRANRSCRRSATRTRWWRAPRHRPEARRPLSPRLDPCRRHRHRRSAVDELVPLYRDPKSDMPVTQFNMKWVEPAGLVKFDFLGLKTLTVLDVAVNCSGSATSMSIWRRCRSTMPRATRCWRAATRSACSRSKARACGARWSTCGPTASRTSSRWWRSIARARWRTSRPTARASTATRSPNICIRCSSRS